jgi:predicted ferric reductase
VLYLPHLVVSKGRGCAQDKLSDRGAGEVTITIALTCNFNASAYIVNVLAYIAYVSTHIVNVLAYIAYASTHIVNVLAYIDYALTHIVNVLAYIAYASAYKN